MDFLVSNIFLYKFAYPSHCPHFPFFFSFSSLFTSTFFFSPLHWAQVWFCPAESKCEEWCVLCKVLRENLQFVNGKGFLTWGCMRDRVETGKGKSYFCWGILLVGYFCCCLLIPEVGQLFLCEGPDRNILGFRVHIVFVATTHLCCCNKKTAVDKM